jgi:hypothetical protein
MRVMIKFALPVESSNAAIRTGKLEKVFHQIAEDLKPEAAYFFSQAGERGGFYIVDAGVVADSGYGRAFLLGTERESRVHTGHVCG